MRLLERIHSPADVKRLARTDLEALASEIRHVVIQTVARNAGHLAPNLGVVELAIAVHRVFDSPDDKIIWDVGHQSYPHKLLTGRFDRFETLRTEGGLAFFRDGGFVHVAAGKTVEQPIQFVYISTRQQRGATFHPRNLVIAEADSQVTILESYVWAVRGISPTLSPNCPSVTTRDWSS